MQMLFSVVSILELQPDGHKRRLMLEQLIRPLSTSLDSQMVRYCTSPKTDLN